MKNSIFFIPDFLAEFCPCISSKNIKGTGHFEPIDCSTEKVNKQHFLTRKGF
jgi:hypothetical protein